MTTLIEQAYKELMNELFGSEVYEEGTKVSDLRVKRSVYTVAMHKVQEKYGLKQGHPDFAGWVFTLISRSPNIIEDEEGEEEQ